MRVVALNEDMQIPAKGMPRLCNLIGSCLLTRIIIGWRVSVWLADKEEAGKEEGTRKEEGT